MTASRRAAIIDALRDRIVSGIHTGRYHGGERLGTSRSLAVEFRVNERVVLAALRALAEDGYIDLRPRSGAYITRPHAPREALPHLGAWFVRTLIEARSRGLPPRDLADFARQCTQTQRLRAACIECNGDQIHLLCSELASDFGILTEGADASEVRAFPPSRALRRADVLVTTMFHSSAVEAVARRLGKPWIAVTLRPNVMDEVTRELHRGPVFVLATDPRFEAKLRRMLGPVAPLDNLRMLIVPDDAIGNIPDDAPTYTMPGAREALRKWLGRAWLPGRPLQPAHYLSDEATRELVAFVVRANLAALHRA